MKEKPTITKTGVDNGDLTQLLYEIVYWIINSGGGATGNFTVAVEDRTGQHVTGTRTS